MNKISVEKKQLDKVINLLQQLHGYLESGESFDFSNESDSEQAREVKEITLYLSELPGEEDSKPMEDCDALYQRLRLNDILPPLDADKKRLLLQEIHSFKLQYQIDYYENKIEMLIRTSAEKENSKLEELEKWIAENEFREEDVILCYTPELKAKIKSLKQGN